MSEAIKTAAAVLGRKGGQAKSPRKSKASRENVQKAQAAMTTEKRSTVAQAVNAHRWKIFVFIYVEGGVELWGDYSLPDGVSIVGVVERDSKIGALLQLPGGEWGMGFAGAITRLPAAKVQAALEEAQRGSE